MRYPTIKDLPFVFQINLPEPAQQIFKDAFNREWAAERDDRAARSRAIAEVRRHFVKDPDTGRWTRGA